ncbi:SPOSA6832_04372 [Sporobolomyces salmonicolor]|uniref:SPOSA6832_04372-mRNA-1:cds n=1 Tax=Sporidiobolus salmonicolor TaxID=5005 RepID=A0A0D6ER03_SPOSA|nr:SPOSA6832_04372 [Sporobolomyces salmonicolor]
MNNNRPFIYPANTGISYSFTDDGYFEEAQYRFEANASDPQCSTAVVIWQHGKYYFHNNGSITLDPAPFASDGRIQVQDPCAATTEVLTYYSQFELYNGWTITVDAHHAAYMLQLYRFDGSLFPRDEALTFPERAPRLYLTVRPPTMLPTTSLEAVYNGSISLS